MWDEEILRFISTFDDVKDFFLNGGCYWFSVILQKEFGGVIYYVPVVNHYIVRIQNKFYDASGEVDYSKYHPEKWNIYKNIDPQETLRLYRDCIGRRTVK